MDGPPHARPAVAATGGRGGFSGLGGRRRVDNDAGVHHNIHAITAVTAAAVTSVTTAAVTAGNVTAVTVTAVTSAAVTAVTAATVAAENITVVTSAAVTAVTTATATAVSVAVMEVQRVSGRTRSKMNQNSDTPTMHFSATLEEPPLPSPVKDGEAFSHNARLLSIAGKKESLSMLNTCGAMDAGRREKLTPAVEDLGGSSYSGGREQLTPAVEDRGGSSYSGGRVTPVVEDRGGSSYGEGREQVAPTVEDRGKKLSAGKSGGIPWAMAAMLATRKDIEATLSGQRPPYKPPDLPKCYARDFKVSRNHTEAMRSEHAHLWKDFRSGILRITGGRGI